VVLVLSASIPDLPRDVSLGDAHLTLPNLPLSEERDLRIHVRALSGPWGGDGDAPVHEGLVGRLNVPAGAPARAIDVTNLVRGIVSGATLYGLLITVPEGSGNGFDEADASLLLEAFQQAELEISYREIPPPPPRRQQ
jgi:hypothetical protein